MGRISVGRMVEKMKIPKQGSRWSGSNGEKFHVLNTIELDGKTWVHYVNEKENPLEYSCYVESFLRRFTELPDDTTKRIR
jgi:hypothetical protein